MIATPISAPVIWRNIPIGIRKRYLESFGELLLAIYLASRTECRHLSEVGVAFEIFKLNADEKQWIEMTTLDDRILFVGEDSRFSVLARDFPGCKGNCIYFYDPCPVNCKYHHMPQRFSNIGVFDIGSGSNASGLPRLRFEIVIYLGNCPISWCSKKQHSVSRSSTEGEYRAMADTANEIFWLRHLLSDIYVSLPLPPLLHCDNASALSLASNPIHKSKCKHVEVDIHFTREKVVKGELNLQFVPSLEQFADIFTKGLSTAHFEYLCCNLVLGNPSTSLRGAVKIIELSELGKNADSYLGKQETDAISGKNSSA